MRILVTGATATQAGRPNRLGYVSTPRAVAEGLTALGHRVEHRPVTPGESLSQFHRVVVFLAPPLIFGGTHLYGALWALASHRRPLASVDDWQLEKLLSEFRSVCRRDHRFLWGSCLAATTRPDNKLLTTDDRHGKHSQAADIRRVLENVADVVAANDWPWATGVPLFPWARLELLPLKPRELHPFDPSSFVPVHEPYCSPGPRRRREWLLPSIADHRKWLAKQTLRWPVRYVGGTQKQAKQDGLERLTEADLVRNVYPRHYGTLCVPYKHAGSGWWRVRFLHAAIAETVLAGDPAELAPIGAGYDLPIAAIEKLSHAKLSELAKEQRATLAGHDVLDKDRFLAQLTGWVR